MESLENRVADLEARLCILCVYGRKKFSARVDSASTMPHRLPLVKGKTYLPSDTGLRLGADDTFFCCLEGERPHAVTLNPFDFGEWDKGNDVISIMVKAVMEQPNP